ncbi:hypothetical protein IAR50_001607 [Cryptococcus sp. DSM 104548]
MGDSPSHPSPSTKPSPGPFSRLSENAPTPLYHPEPEPSQSVNINPAANVGAINAAIPQPPSVEEGNVPHDEAKNAPSLPPAASGVNDDDVEMRDVSKDELDGEFTPAPPTAASSPSKPEGEDSTRSLSKGNSDSGLATTNSLTNGLKSSTSSVPSPKKGQGKTKVDELKGTEVQLPDSRSATPPASTTPTLISSPSGALVDADTVYCICRRPYDEEEDESLMVGCESCDGWFHAECVGLDENKVDLLDVYICKSCEGSTAQRTIYKQACKRDGCNKSVSGSNSKFCSSRCAYRYSQAALGAVTSKQAIKQLTKGLAAYPTPNTGVSVIHHIPPSSEYYKFPYDEIQVQLAMVQNQLESTLKAISIIQKRQALLSAVMEKCENLTPIVVEDSVQPKKSKKKGGAPAQPKEDKPCGWAAVLIAEDEEVDQGIKGQGAEIVMEGAEAWEVCMVARRKCDRHQGWQKTIAVALDFELATLSRTQSSLLESQRWIEESIETEKISTEARDSFLAKRDSIKQS